MVELADLANKLRVIASHIAQDELESRPACWALVLEGENGQHEILLSGTLTRSRVAKMGGVLGRFAWDAKADAPKLKLYEPSGGGA